MFCQVTILISYVLYPPSEEQTPGTRVPALAFPGSNPPKLPTKHLRHGGEILHTEG